MIVADTGGILALLDRKDRHHLTVRELHRTRGDEWLLPWAIVPEVEYLATKYLGARVAEAFLADLRDGCFRVDAQVPQDLPRALEIVRRHAALGLSLVDAVVMAQAERNKASVIVTTDGRHFRAVRLKLEPMPRLVPLDPEPG